jgi:hypothetical protein
VQLKAFEPETNQKKHNYGFLPETKTASEIEGELISDESIRDPSKGSNPFQLWLKAKTEKTMKKNQIKKTQFLKKVCEL